MNSDLPLDRSTIFLSGFASKRLNLADPTRQVDGAGWYSDGTATDTGRHVDGTTESARARKRRSGALTVRKTLCEFSVAMSDADGSNLFRKRRVRRVSSALR